MATMSLENSDSRPFWEGIREGRLLLQQCNACSHIQFPPRHMCAKCWNTELDWRECSGKGVVESFTLVTRAPTPDMRDKVPYVVASVILEEGPRMMSNIVGPDASQTAIDDAVQITFEADQHGRLLPQFRRGTASSG